MTYAFISKSKNSNIKPIKQSSEVLSLPEDNDPCLGEGMLLGMELCRDVL